MAKGKDKVYSTLFGNKDVKRFHGNGKGIFETEIGFVNQSLNNKDSIENDFVNQDLENVVEVGNEDENDHKSKRHERVLNLDSVQVISPNFEIQNCDEFENGNETQSPINGNDSVTKENVQEIRKEKSISLFLPNVIVMNKKEVNWKSKASIFSLSDVGQNLSVAVQQAVLIAQLVSNMTADGLVQRTAAVAYWVTGL